MADNKDVVCFKCGGTNLSKHGFRGNVRYYYCKDCKWSFPEKGLRYIIPVKCDICGSTNTKKKSRTSNGKKTWERYCNACKNFCSDIDVVKLLNDNKQICNECGEIKSFNQFYTSKKNKNGHKHVCKTCFKTKMMFLKRYGMTIMDFNKMLLSQNNKCAICGDSFINRSSSPHVDHCHKTGKIRSLLCQACNKMLGFAKENIKTFEMAIIYLKNHK